MEERRTQDLTAALAGALDWWRDAGVDYDYSDAPRAWITAAEDAPPPTVAAKAALAAPLPPATVATDRSGWPASLAEFPAWWLNAPLLDSGDPAERVPPRGSAGASLMVLVEQPEAEDRTTLLSGREGALLAAMLKAMGIAADGIYVASALPRHTPMADWPALSAAGLGAVTAHHLALAAPQRLIAFGSNILPLLGHDPAKTSGASRVFNHEGVTIPLLPALSLGALLATPRRKAALWRDWLDWTGTTV